MVPGRWCRVSPVLFSMQPQPPLLGRLTRVLPCTGARLASLIGRRSFTPGSVSLSRLDAAMDRIRVLIVQRSPERRAAYFHKCCPGVENATFCLQCACAECHSSLLMFVLIRHESRRISKDPRLKSWADRASDSLRAVLFDKDLTW